MEEDRATMTGAVATRDSVEPSEDILICVDVDAESTVEMKTTGTNGKPLNKLECLKLAITRFIHDKLSRNSDHRFAFATLSQSAAWLKKEFSNDAKSAAASLREMSATRSSGPADLTFLFQEAAQEAKTSRAQNRILRVILMYCRSSVRPTHDWPINQKLFTLDVMYLHDKSGPDNCTHDVYDSLVDAIERVSEYEGYIFEDSHGLAQSVFRRMSTLLSHPPQRCAQVDLPKPPAKKPAVSCDKSASDSTKGAKQPLEKNPKTNTKRIHSLGKEKTSDFKKYDEKIVGSRVKIWWPLDRAYYEAVVISYCSAKERHRVRYIDGDEEILNMRKEKWYFLNESKSSKDKEANQTGCDEEASTMPQKKKAKTRKEQSTNKQSKMLSPFPPNVKKDDEVPQISRRQAEQVLSNCASQIKKYLTEAGKLSSVSLANPSDVVDSICGRAFDALKQEDVVANEKEDRQGPREAAVKEQQKAAEVSTPELTCVPERGLNLEQSLSVCPHDSSVKSAISSMNENGHKILEMVQQPVAEEEDLAETKTKTYKRARVESSSVHKADGEMEKEAAEGEPSCRSHKSSAESGDLQPKNLPEPCSVTQQLAKVKQSILDTVASVRQFRCELERKEQSIADTLSIVRQFRSEIEEKEDMLEASLLEIDVLGM
ncbi:hypothetical protein AXX17_AT4G37790 [Arabidopsis thaliana]|uniref:New component of the BRCA1-A complex n=1 Tax=Arabidopsis thaliana TaxID=3702 RepID=A0A178UV91_ARATH|nr:hypothetical protein AXX17_AT4G37790 [Arabidopsis thaliana]